MSNPWANTPHSLLATAKEKRHIRLGGLRGLLQSHGVISEASELDGRASVAPSTAKYFDVLDKASVAKDQMLQMSSLLAETTLDAATANVLSKENLSDRLSDVEKLNHYLAYIRENEEKIRLLLEQRSQQPHHDSVLIEPAYHNEFASLLARLNELLAKPATSLENIRWSQMNGSHQQKLQKVDARLEQIRQRVNQIVA